MVAPRGIGSMIGLPIVGALTHRVDNRWLLTWGFGFFGVCTIWFSNINPSIGPMTMLFPILLTGFALSFVFVPIGNMADLQRFQRADGKRHRHL